jgi:hypothetical protein
MAAGQGAFWVAADAAALTALETRLEVQETARAAAHAEQLRMLLQLDGLYLSRGMSISTVPHAALALGGSEHRAAALLDQARGLAELPGALEALGCGLLTVEQSAVLVRELSVLPLTGRLAVWRRLQQRLVDDGSALPPARLSELLRRWVVEADPADAVERRRKAREDRQVDYRLRQDGLGDLFAFGFTGPELQAVLSRIAQASRPFGVEDERTADQRRFDALRDLLLGRTTLDGGCCPPGEVAPCGAEIVVHLPIGAALSTTDEAAEQVGIGPLEPDLVQDLLLAAPRLRPAWVDQDGTVVAVGDRTVRPQRGDPQSVRDTLLALVDLPPPDVRPHARSEHARREASPDGRPPEGRARPSPSPDALPAGDPGRYRPPRWLRRLVNARAPRCEWPGCGARAVRCDAEHDLAWPDGPTCACNLGPCCRRHHQVKQQGWTKQRTAAGAGVTWTAPTGLTWRSAAQHPPLAEPVRPVPPVATADEWDELSPTELEVELHALGLLPPDDPRSWATPDDIDPGDAPDPLGERLLDTDTRWTLDLADPYRWLDLVQT